MRASSWGRPVAFSGSRRFAAVVAERYRGVVPAWELWNEPDNEDYWRGTPEEFARMVTGAARQVRRVDPQAVVVLGGMAKGRGPFVDALVGRLGVDRSFDVVNVHGYLETWSREPAEQYPQRIDAMAALLPPPERGPDLWLAELGYSDHRVSPGEPVTYTHELYAYEHTPEYQATSLIKHHVLARVPENVSLTVWYRVDDLPPTDGVIGDEHNRHLGVLDVAGNRKPSFYALRFYNRLFDRPARTLDARVRVIRPEGSQSEVHVFEKKGGGTLVFGWLRTPRQREGEAPRGAMDGRHERISVVLPGSGYRTMTVYDAHGEVLASPARLVEGAVEHVDLSGDRVFIAEIAAERPASPHGRPRHLQGGPTMARRRRNLASPRALRAITDGRTGAASHVACMSTKRSAPTPRKGPEMPDKPKKSPEAPGKPKKLPPEIPGPRVDPQVPYIHQPEVPEPASPEPEVPPQRVAPEPR